MSECAGDGAEVEKSKLEGKKTKWVTMVEAKTRTEWKPARADVEGGWLDVFLKVAGTGERGESSTKRTPTHTSDTVCCISMRIPFSTCIHSTCHTTYSSVAAHPTIFVYFPLK